MQRFVHKPAGLLISRTLLNPKTMADIPEYMGCINRVGENQKRTKFFWSMSGHVCFFGFSRKKQKNQKKMVHVWKCLVLVFFLEKKQKTKKQSFLVHVWKCLFFLFFPRKKQKTKKDSFLFHVWKYLFFFLEKPKFPIHGPKNFGVFF